MNTKPLLIFVHGMFCYDAVWNKIVSYFQALDYDCLAVNLPFHDQKSHKQADPRLGTTSILDYVQYVREIVLSTGRDCILIGHSMGGLIVMITAGLPDVNPKSIVLLAPAAPAGVIALESSVLKAFTKIMSTPFFWRKPVVMDFEDLSAAMLNCLPERKRWRIYQGLKPESGRAAFEMGFWFIDRKRATRINPKGITCPVTIFIGEEDQITPHKVVVKTAKKLGYKPPKVGQMLEPRIQQVELISLPGHGHWLLTELDLRLLEAVLNK